MYYLFTILACMTIISTLNVIFATASVGYIVMAVVASTLAVIAVDGIFSTLVRRCLPTKWFGIDKKFFSAGKKECRFYEKIGIKKWKDKVLELGMFTNFRKNKISDPSNNEYLSRYILEANYGILCHLACIVFGYSIIFIYPLKYMFCFGVPVASVNAVLNLLPIFILRYNLPKLHTLFKYNARRTVKA